MAAVGGQQTREIPGRSSENSQVYSGQKLANPVTGLVPTPAGIGTFKVSEQLTNFLGALTTSSVACRLILQHLLEPTVCVCGWLSAVPCSQCVGS